MRVPAQTGDRPDPHLHLIQSQGDLTRFFDRLRGVALLAIDTEAASFHRYRDRIYLLQVSSRHETAVIDPLAVGSLAPLADVLADPAIEIVFHDADYDLRLLDLEYGFRATNLFDTRIAAQLLNEPGVGLAALLEKHFGIRLDKRFQRADWSARPLTTEMLEYAAADTRHLPELRDILQHQLRERGRLEWAKEEFALLSGVRWVSSEPGEPAYLRIKGAKALPGRALAVLRELYQWREDYARRMDKAAFRILNNEPMIAMAQSPPSTISELKAVRGLNQDLVERRGREIVGAIQRGLAVAESDLPRIERQQRKPYDAAYESRLERLKAARNLLATQYDLAPGVLCPNGTLEAIARRNPTDLEQMGELDELRRWQLREIGPTLMAALQRPAA